MHTFDKKFISDWREWSASFPADRPRPTDFREHLDLLPSHTRVRRCDDRLAEALGSHAPRFLYFRGTSRLDDLTPRVAIVGSRSLNGEGHRLARWVASDVARLGATIVSGGARGTDAVAHEQALAAGAPTICVLPCGIDQAAPKRHRRLFEEISETGLLVAAYPPGVGVRKFHYHDRNALIAAISDVVIVIRARPKSGSRITAEHALRIGTPLFALSGAPDDEHALGCLELIRKGAEIYTSVDDLRHIVGEAKLGVPEPSTRSNDGLPPAGTAVLRALYDLGGSGTVDEIADSVALPVSSVTSQLVELELWGQCSRAPGGTEVVLSPSVAAVLENDASR